MNKFLQSISDFWEFEFLLYAFIGTIILALICGLISPFIIARKRSFMGVAVSHAALFGVAIGLSIFNKEQATAVFLTTLIATLALVSFLARADLYQKLPSDSLIGVFFTTSMGLGILVYTFFHKGSGDLMGYLFGNILLLTKQDIVIAIVILAITFPAIIIPFRKWIYTTFDRQSALLSGINANLYHYAFFSLITLIIISSLKIAGTILINTLLLIPGVVGLRLGTSIRGTFIISVLFSVITSVIGLALSNFLDTPSGATLAVGQSIMLLLLLLIQRLVTR